MVYEELFTLYNNLSIAKFSWKKNWINTENKQCSKMTKLNFISLHEVFTKDPYRFVIYSVISHHYEIAKSSGMFIYWSKNKSLR